MNNEPKLSAVQPLFMTAPEEGKPQLFGDSTGRIWFRTMDSVGWSGWAEMTVVSGCTKTVTDAQVETLVMMVKLLAHDLRKGHPDHARAVAAMDYLQREGLVSASDALRTDAKDPE